MAAYGMVRFLVKQGQAEEFERRFASAPREFPGLRKFALVKTGDHRYCSVGEWDSMDSMAAARPAMIANLDGFRELLEDQGNGLGCTDPVSGEAVYEVDGTQPTNLSA